MDTIDRLRQEVWKQLDDALADYAEALNVDLTTDEEQETTTARDVDSIGAYTLEELFAMNGSKFPFSAVKVSSTDGMAPFGTVVTFTGQRYSDGKYVNRGWDPAATTIRAWQFADPDFDVKD